MASSPCGLLSGIHRRSRSRRAFAIEELPFPDNDAEVLARDLNAAATPITNP